MDGFLPINHFKSMNYNKILIWVIEIYSSVLDISKEYKEENPKANGLYTSFINYKFIVQYTVLIDIY